jgi:putative Mg2+ transporter-C (MgtC) family protein
MDTMADIATSTHLSFTTIALRLLGAVFLGSIIGIEREWRSRPAGLRTHILTSLAAALFTVLTIEIVHSDMLLQENSRADPIRIIEAVTAGVAFLAAGTIIRGEKGVRGLTTGAGMWLAGSLGVAAGMGQFSVAILAALLGFVVISLLGWAERSMQDGKRQSED